MKSAKYLIAVVDKLNSETQDVRLFPESELIFTFNPYDELVTLRSDTGQEIHLHLDECTKLKKLLQKLVP